jgi:hypothetical protein
VCRKRDLDLADLEGTRWETKLKGEKTKKNLAHAVVASALRKSTAADLPEGEICLCRSSLASPGGEAEDDGG